MWRRPRARWSHSAPPSLGCGQRQRRRKQGRPRRPVSWLCAERRGTANARPWTSSTSKRWRRRGTRWQRTRRRSSDDDRNSKRSSPWHSATSSKQTRKHSVWQRSFRRRRTGVGPWRPSWERPHGASRTRTETAKDRGQTTPHFGHLYRHPPPPHHPPSRRNQHSRPPRQLHRATTGFRPSSKPLDRHPPSRRQPKPPPCRPTKAR
mmetsp:Transcript_63086/g.137133  ORF Transcript_63086/g.137133 Transcript_63086/m.137133 type:complete len:206 (+) Transcript_63086:397-1014(+)